MDDTVVCLPGSIPIAALELASSGTQIHVRRGSCKTNICICMGKGKQVDPGRAATSMLPDILHCVYTNYSETGNCRHCLTPTICIPDQSVKIYWEKYVLL